MEPRKPQKTQHCSRLSRRPLQERSTSDTGHAQPVDASKPQAGSAFSFSWMGRMQPGLSGSCSNQQKDKHPLTNKYKQYQDSKDFLPTVNDIEFCLPLLSSIWSLCFHDATCSKGSDINIGVKDEIITTSNPHPKQRGNTQHKSPR